MKKTWLITALLAAFLANIAQADEELLAPSISEPSAPISSAASATARKNRASTPNSASTPARAASAPQELTPGQDLLFSALGLIGVKYKWGGNDPTQGLDCSGFVKYVFQNSLKLTLPRTALQMSRVGETVDRDALKPGDLVFFNTLKRQFSHVGIYLGDNRFVHAPRKGKRIEVVNINDKYWSSRFNGGRRISDHDTDTVDVASLLAFAGNKQAEVNAQIRTEKVAPAQSCRKVTKGTGAKRKTVTVCKPASSQVTRKPAAKPKASTKPAAKATKKPAKPAAKTTKKPAKPAAKKTQKP
jgi:cell wall-associated NlpC family hydrolase